MGARKASDVTLPFHGVMFTAFLLMTKDRASENSIISFLVILIGVVLFFSLLCAVLFRVFPWPTSAADFGEAISGVSALFTALAFAGALYAVFLQRKALELQQRQMTKEIGEVREQTKLLADQFQQIAPIGRAYDRLEAVGSVLDAVLDVGKASIGEAIMYLPTGDFKTELEKLLAEFLDAADKYIVAGGRMETEAMARLLARGGRAKAQQKWISKREEIARQLGEWATGINATRAALEKERSSP